MHANIYKTFQNKHKRSLLTPLISKNDYDKPKVKNIMILYNVKVEKHRNILQSCNLQIFLKKIIRKLEAVEKNLRNKREKKKTTQEISNSRRRTQINKKKLKKKKSYNKKKKKKRRKKT